MRDPEVKTTERKHGKPTVCFHGLQLFAVQSSACVLALLTVLLLRVIGGDAIDDVSARFQEAMLQNSVLTAQAVDTTDTAQTAVGGAQTVVQTVCAPLSGGIITSLYGNREDPFDATVTDDHTGVDIAADGGTPLAAFRGGTVEKVGYEENGYGHYILVRCDNEHSYLYAHCSSVVKIQGETVTAGEIIAYVGSTGRSTGDHVHIEWFENGSTVDPLTVLPAETYA